MNPGLIILLCALIFMAGAAFGVVFGHNVVERDGARIDFLEQMCADSRRDWHVRIQKVEMNFGVYSHLRGWKYRSTLRGAIDAHRNGEAAVIEESKVVNLDGIGHPVVGLTP